MTIGVPRAALPPHYVAELLTLARHGGLDAVGVCTAQPFAREREVLEARKSEGLHGDMQFTYRNPARSTDPASTVRGARSLIVGALAYRRRLARAAADAVTGPVLRVGAFAWEDYYATIRNAFAPVVDRLHADGHRAFVATDENCLVDRAAAVRAGLGYYGKNANVLLPGRGSWYVIGSVITDAALVDIDPPPVRDGCGTCRQCIDGCPTGAIIGPGIVDARRCLAWLLQAPGVFPRSFRQVVDNRLYGCDDCQEVCPPNKRRDHNAPLAPAHARSSVPALLVLETGDHELGEQLGSWYIYDRDFDILRRNALIALGNALAAGEPMTAAIQRVLRRYLHHERDMLRAHAVWAVRRAGRDDLLSCVRDDPSPLVRNELEAADV